MTDAMMAPIAFRGGISIKLPIRFTMAPAITLKVKARSWPVGTRNWVPVTLLSPIAKMSSTAIWIIEMAPRKSWPRNHGTRLLATPARPKQIGRANSQTRWKAFSISVLMWARSFLTARLAIRGIMTTPRLVTKVKAILMIFWDCS